MSAACWEPPRARRCGALLVVALGAVAGTLPALRDVPARNDFDGLLAWAAAWLLVGVAGWAAIVATAVLLSSVPGTGLAGRCLLRLCCPRRFRGALLAALGAATVAGVATPAHAEGWRPPSLARPVDGLASAEGPASADRVTVRRGDSLWVLLRSRFPRADDATLAVLVRRTYAANRSTIGPDPDLVQPGEQLRMPAARSAR